MEIEMKILHDLSGQLVYWLLGWGRVLTWFVMTADFCGINTSIVAV